MREEQSIQIVDDGTSIRISTSASGSIHINYDDAEFILNILSGTMAGSKSRRAAGLQSTFKASKGGGTRTRNDLNEDKKV